MENEKLKEFLTEASNKGFADALLCIPKFSRENDIDSKILLSFVSVLLDNQILFVSYDFKE